LDYNYNNKNVYMHGCHDGQNQQWYLDDAGRLKTKHDGYCLDYNHNNKNVYMHKCHDGKNQKWYFDNAGRLKTKHDGNCLDYNYNNKNVYMHRCHGGKNQQWLINGKPTFQKKKGKVNHEAAAKQKALEQAKRLAAAKAAAAAAKKKAEEAAAKKKKAEIAAAKKAAEAAAKKVAAAVAVRAAAAKAAAAKQRKNKLAAHGGWTFYKVPTKDTGDAGIKAACQAAGLVTPCAGAAGCRFNGGGCTMTSETGCGMPMWTTAKAVCGGRTYPSKCSQFTKVYTFMGFKWVGKIKGCGVNAGHGWCDQGAPGKSGYAFCAERTKAAGKKKCADKLKGLPCKQEWAFVMDSKKNLVAVKKGPKTGSGKTEVHRLTASSNYKTYDLQTATALQITDGNWDFVMDSKDNLLAILKGPNTGSGKTEVHRLSASSNYQKFDLQTGTGLGLSSKEDWAFTMDSKDRLVCVKKGPTGSRKTEVHRLTASSNYKTFDLHTATGLHYTNAAAGLGDWDFLMDPQDNLVCILKGPKSGSGKTEVHKLTQASNFNTFSLHTSTALQYSDTDWAFAMAGNDLVGILKGPTSGSCMTEVHKLNGAANYGKYNLQVGTGLKLSAPTSCLR